MLFFKYTIYILTNILFCSHAGRVRILRGRISAEQKRDKYPNQECAGFQYVFVRAYFSFNSTVGKISANMFLSKLD